MLAPQGSCSGHQSLADICPHHKIQAELAAQFSVSATSEESGEVRPCAGSCAGNQHRDELEWLWEKAAGVQGQTQMPRKAAGTSTAKIPKMLPARAEEGACVPLV